MTPPSADPLRVLHLRSSDRFGGPERLLVDQVRAAAPHVEAAVASFGRGDAPHPFLDRAGDEGVTTFRVEASCSYDPRVCGRVRHLLASWSPDVVVGHDYRADLVLALSAGPRPRVAVVHGYTAENAKIRFFEYVDRRILRRAHAVVVVTEALRDRLVAARVTAERIRVVANGVHAERVATAAAEGRDALRAAWGYDDEVVVLVLGRWSPEKGPDVALEAFAGIADDRARLVLVGDGALREALEARARAPDLAGRVRLEGWRRDPWRCLGAADVFLLPSRREGVPLALLEAMAARRAVVAADVGGVGEVLVRDGACGRLVPAGDPEALRRALRAVLADERERARLGAAAHERVVAAYDVVGQARRLEAIYAEACAP